MLESKPFRGSLPRFTQVPGRLLVLLASLFSVAVPGARGEETTVALASIRRSGTRGLLLEGRVPEQHYAVIEANTGAGTPYVPIQVLIPTGVPGTFRTGVALSALKGAALFRIVALSFGEPGDQDGDGMDDVYEALRSHVLDPLDPSDARRDADGDGDSNLTEYLSRTESAPPPAGTPVRYASLVDLRLHAPAQLPPLIHLGGYEAEGDGWGGWFAWLEDDTRIDDGALRVAFRSIGPGRLERVVDPGDPIRAAWWRPSIDPGADAGPALQKAIEAMSSRTYRKLILDPGRYHVRAQVAYTDTRLSPLRLVGIEDFELDGAGATIWSETDGELLMLENCHRGVVRNLGVEGSGSSRGMPDGNYTAIGLVGEQSDLEFNKCRVKGFMHGLSHLHGEKTSVRVTVRGCWFEDGTDFAHGTLGADGAAISGIGNDWLIENCFFHECGRGVEIENTDKASPIRGVIVRGNRMTQVRNLGVMAYLGGAASQADQQSDILVRDNLIVGSRPRYVAPRGGVVPVMCIAINGGSRWVIQGNVCQDADYAGISVYANQASSADSVISGNVVSGVGGRGIQVFTLDTLESRGVLVSGNRIVETYGPGILLAGDHHTAQGNLVENTSIGIALGDPTGLQQTARFLIARGNTILSVPSGLPAIAIAPWARGTSVSDNDIVDASLGVQNLSPDAFVEGNRFRNVAVEVETEPPADPPTEPPAP